VKTPPSAATSQYPPPSGVGAIPRIGAFSPGRAIPNTVDAAVPKAVTVSGPAVPDSAMDRAPELPGWIAMIGGADAAETDAPAAIDPDHEMHTHAATGARRSRVRDAVDRVPGRTK
jgi:hypothetical protein